MEDFVLPIPIYFHVHGVRHVLPWNARRTLPRPTCQLLPASQSGRILGNSILYYRLLGGIGIVGFLLFLAFLVSAASHKKTGKTPINVRTTVKLVECPRDAWQGLPEFIPTETKVAYLRELITAGFQHIDAVSFVSPKHVKQMADSEEVMAKLLESLPDGATLPEIIGIVVNEKGLERALATPGVSTIGYPYSISAYFRRSNANMNRAESRALVEILKTGNKKGQQEPGDLHLHGLRQSL